MQLHRIFQKYTTIAKQRHHIPHFLRTILRLLRQHLHQHHVQFGSTVFVDRRWWCRFLTEVFFEQVIRTETCKWRTTRGDFIQRDTQTVNIRLGSGRASHDDLRRNIGSRAHDVFLLPSQQLHHTGRQPGRKAEVNHTNFTSLVHQNIVRLDVPMQPAFFIEVNKCLTDRFHDFLHPGLCFRQVRRQLCFQAGSPEIVHQQKAVIPVDLQLMEPHKSWVLKLRTNFVLMLQHGLRLRTLQRIRQQQLHRKRHRPPLLHNLPHLRRASGGNAVLQFVSADNILVLCHKSNPRRTTGGSATQAANTVR